MAGPVSNYSDEILEALASLQQHGQYSIGGTPSVGSNDKALAEDPLARAMEAAAATLSGRENQQGQAILGTPYDVKRITDPLDRSRYRGS